jgi:hypothetical protein
VVDVVKANVAGKPLQQRRQSVIRTAVAGRSDEVPLIVRSPVGLLELMLHEEQPAAEPRGKDYDWQMDEEKSLDVDGKRGHAQRDKDSGIGQVHAPAFAPPRAGDAVSKALAKNKQDARADEKHEQWMPV